MHQVVGEPSVARRRSLPWLHRDPYLPEGAVPKTVFVGNCQFASLSEFYEENFAESPDVVQYVNGHPDTIHGINTQFLELSETDQHKLHSAERVILQVSDKVVKDKIAYAAPSAEIIPVPLIAASFFWPFAGRPHPKNKEYPYAVNGPYDAELGDIYLNRLIAEGVDVDDAVARYLGLDFSQRTNLDRLFELWLDVQRRRDQTTGFEIADTVMRLFRQEQVFLTPHHPNLTIWRHFVRQVLERLHCEPAEVDRALSSLRESPYRSDTLPIHPHVARHYDLQWWSGDDQRFPYSYEGSFTFAEYVRRYMMYEWNEPLAEGIHLARLSDAPGAGDRLREGLARSPNSVEGNLSLCRMLLRDKAFADAVETAERAVILDPTHVGAHYLLGSCLWHAGDLVRAEAALRQALAIHPSYAWASVDLATMLLTSGRVQEAEEVVMQALTLHPYNSDLLSVAADVLVAAEKFGPAEIAIRRAIQREPQNVSLSLKLADVLVKKTRYDVVQVYLSSIALRPDDPLPYAKLGAYYLQHGEFQGAEAVLRTSTELNPSNAEYKNLLVHAVLLQNRVNDAHSLAVQFVRFHPSDVPLKLTLDKLKSDPRLTKPDKVSSPGLH